MNESTKEMYMKMLNDDLPAYQINSEEICQKMNEQRDIGFTWLAERLSDRVCPSGTKCELPQELSMFTDAPLWGAIRHTVMFRDGGLCQICKGNGVEVHHIRPKQYGGTNDPRNLITLCHECHVAVHHMLDGMMDRLFGYVIGEGE